MKKLLNIFLILLIFGVGVSAGTTNFDTLVLSEDLTVADDVTITDDLTVSGDTAITGTLTQTGDPTFSSSVTAKPLMTITNSNADATGATLTLKKDSATPADTDGLGNIIFEGWDSEAPTTENATVYAKVIGSMPDETEATEDGQFDIQIMKAGTLTSALKLTGGTLTMDVPTASATLTTGNVSITVVIGGVTYYIKANTGI